MAIDFDKIKKKVNQLAGKNRASNVFWRPDPGEYEVRIMPWPDGNDGQPFKERYFYYNIGTNPGILAPYQFGKADPIQELIQKNRDEGSQDLYEFNKKLYPKMRAYAPVIVRGQEGDGVRLWSFGKRVYEELLAYFLDEDFGDITDVNSGNDVKVKITKQPGQTWANTSTRARPKSTKLGTKAQIDDWTVNVPELDEIYTLKTYEEIEKMVNDWLSGGDTEDTGTDHVESRTETGPGDVKRANDDLDSVLAEVMGDD